MLLAAQERFKRNDDSRNLVGSQFNAKERFRASQPFLTSPFPTTPLALIKAYDVTLGSHQKLHDFSLSLSNRYKLTSFHHSHRTFNYSERGT